MIMEKLYEKIVEKDNWVFKNRGSLFIWKKSPSGLIVRLSYYKNCTIVAEFTNAKGTIAAFEIPESLLLLYINENKVFVEKLLEYLTEVRNVIQIVPEQFFESIKNIALQYSTKETLAAVNEYAGLHNWEFKIAEPWEKKYTNNEPLTILEDGWTCSDFGASLVFLKKIADEIITIKLSTQYDFNIIQFYFIQTYFWLDFSKNSIKTLLKNDNLYAILKYCSQVAENENIDAKDFVAYFTEIVKDCGCDYTFKCTLKHGSSYVLGEHLIYNPETNETREWKVPRESSIFVFSDKEKEAIRKAVQDFDNFVEYAHKNYICASFLPQRQMKIYFKKKENSIYYSYVGEYLTAKCIDLCPPETPRVVIGETLGSFYDKWRLSGRIVCHYLNPNQKNPLYEAAKENNERQMELVMKDLLHEMPALTNEEVKELKTLTKGNYLWRLGEEHNKKYFIDKNTVDFKLLNVSRYGMTLPSSYPGDNNPWLNPHRKYADFTGREEGEVISFSEYLKLFEIPEDK